MYILTSMSLLLMIFRFVLCSLKSHSIRQWEVAEWIIKQRRTIGQHCKMPAHALAWVALDDDLSLSDDPKFQELCAPHTVQTISNVGLTDVDADAAIEILRRSICDCPQLEQDPVPSGHVSA
jgi:hypothetical protein